MGIYEVEVRGLRVRIADDLLYTETDEWARVEDDSVRVGITDYAQKMLRDIVGVELPEVGRSVKRGEPVATLESVKATAEVYAPVSGEVTKVNERLLEEPETINKDPYGDGWILVLRVADKAELGKLLDHKGYVAKLLKS